MKIDIFSHILPNKYKEALHKEIPGSFYKTLHDSTPALFDLDKRFHAMDNFEDLTQVLTPTAPPVENIVDPLKAKYLSRLANDEMAELVLKYKDRFISAVAWLPMGNIDDALEEASRAITELDFKGIEIFTPMNDKPLDSPEFFPLYEMMSRHDLPIWIHPERPMNYPDYRTEKRSKYRIHVAFGWVYETTVAMTRLVLSGILERFPNLKFITHHAGGMIPFFEKRIIWSIERAKISEEDKFNHYLKRPLTDYFKMFYNDTALYGSTSGLMCSYAFFGADHLLFGTDMPFGGQLGETFVRETITSIEGMDISDAEKETIFEHNARKILRLSS